METSYEEFGGSYQKNKANDITFILKIVTAITCILLIAVTIIAIVLGVSNNSSSSSNTDYCTTSDCLQLAADLSKTINTSVGTHILNFSLVLFTQSSLTTHQDPCDDFYHYVCDGWDDENRFAFTFLHIFCSINPD